MANKVRGQIAADFEGKPINLILSTNAICELEDRAGVSIVEFMDRLQTPAPKLKDARLMFWAMMLDEMPDATLVDAGKLIDGLRGRKDQIMTDAILAAFPDADEDDQAEK